MIEIFSIGHSRHPWEQFVALLHQHEIDTLVDVRSLPQSRWTPWFGKNTLVPALDALGIRYEWMGDNLGGLDKTVSTTSFGFQVSLGKAVGMAGGGNRVALMCSEGIPGECHRAGKLFAWVHRDVTAGAIKTTHIMRDGTLVDGRAYEPRIIKEERWHELDWSDVPMIGKGK